MKKKQQQQVPAIVNTILKTIPAIAPPLNPLLSILVIYPLCSFSSAFVCLGSCESLDSSGSSLVLLTVFSVL